MVLDLIHVRTRRPAPIEAAPHPNGNVVADLLAGTYQVLGAKALAYARTDPAVQPRLRINHFATCPQAPSFHRPK
jgi:hypothetical protein